MAKGGKAGQVAVWILLVMLIVGLAGFGIGGFGGSVRTIGHVGDQEIGTSDYARALRQEINAIVAQTGQPLPTQQALALGIDRAVRQQLVTTAALDDLAARAGLSVGDARLAEEIRAMAAFGGAGGGFDRNTYRFMLEQNGFSEAAFEARVRADLARGLLQRAVATGPDAPDALGAAVYAYLAERRDITLVRLTEADLDAPLPQPDEAALRAFHAANEAAYTRPEGRRLTYAALLPEALVDQVPADEDALRAAYAARLDEFVQPERRLVERLAFATLADAEAARNRLDGGTAEFDTLVAERGLSLADVDLGDVAEDDLGEAGAAVFAAEAPAIVGPLPSSLGPALFRVNGVLAAESVSFDEARPDLLAEFAMDAARRIVADRVEAIEDLLAGGATLEDLATEAGMQVATIELFPSDTEGMAAYPAFRERAAAAVAGDYPEVFLLDDGGLAALRLDAVVPPALRPFETVADQVAADWRAARLAEALSARAGAVEAALRAGAEAGGDAGAGTAEALTGLTRDGFVEGVPPAVLARAFEMNEGGIARIEAEGFTGLVRVDAITPADLQAPEAVLLRAAFAAQAGQEMAQDAFALFARAVEQGAEIRLDEGAIAAVHAQVQ